MNTRTLILRTVLTLLVILARLSVYLARLAWALADWAGEKLEPWLPDSWQTLLISCIGLAMAMLIITKGPWILAALML